MNDIVNEDIHLKHPISVQIKPSSVIRENTLIEMGSSPPISEQIVYDTNNVDEI